MLAHAFAVDAHLVISACSSAPTSVGVVEMLKRVALRPTVSTHVAQTNRAVTTTVVDVVPVFARIAAWKRLALAIAPKEARWTAAAPVRTHLAESAPSTATAVPTIVSVLQGITHASTVAAPLTNATRPAATAVLRVVEVVERVTPALRDALKFTVTATIYVARPTDASALLTQGVSTTWTVASTVFRVAEVLKRIAGAHPVVAGLTNWAGALAGTIAAVGQMHLCITRAGRRLGELACSVAQDITRPADADALLTQRVGLTRATAATVEGVLGMLQRVAGALPLTAQIPLGARTLARTVDAVVDMLVRVALTLRECAQLAAIVAPNVAVRAEAAPILADTVGWTGAKASAVLGVIEVIVGLADTCPVDASLLPRHARTIASTIVGVVAVDLRIADALAFDTRLEVAALADASTVVGVRQVLDRVTAMTVYTRFARGAGSVASAVVGVEAMKSWVTAGSVDA